jgi:hypothetical protein
MLRLNFMWYRVFAEQPVIWDRDVSASAVNEHFPEESDLVPFNEPAREVRDGACPGHA